VLEAPKAAQVRRFVFFSTIKAMSRDGAPQVETRTQVRTCDYNL
jgi:hypothetical protein